MNRSVGMSQRIAYEWAKMYGSGRHITHCGRADGFNALIQENTRISVVSVTDIRMKRRERVGTYLAAGTTENVVLGRYTKLSGMI
jgi:hypothetical protein